MSRSTTPARSTTPDDDGSAYPELRDREWLREQYIERRRSMADIAAELGCNKSTVSRWLSRHDIETRDRGESLTPRYPMLRDREWLREQYIGRGRTMSEIASEVGCDSSTVSKWFCRHGIPARPPGPRPDDGDRDRDLDRDGDQDQELGEIERRAIEAVSDA